MTSLETLIYAGVAVDYYDGYWRFQRGDKSHKAPVRFGDLEDSARGAIKMGLLRD